MLEFDSIITNGYVDSSTIASFTERGWTFVVTLPAKIVHPHARDTDKWTLFTKCVPYEPTVDPTRLGSVPETGCNA